MPALSKETLETLTAVLEPLTYFATLVAALSGVGFLLANRPLQRMASEQTRALELKVTEQQERAANAERSAAEAKLQLARLIQPRALTDEQKQRVISMLTTFKGQKFSFNVYPDGESIALATTLDATLKSAGWDRIESQLGDIVVSVAGQSAGQSASTGLQALIGPEDETSVAALRAFASALESAGVPCAIHRTDELKGKTPMAIVVVIGSKPK